MFIFALQKARLQKNKHGYKVQKNSSKIKWRSLDG